MNSSRAAARRGRLLTHYRQISTHSYFSPFQTCSDRQSEVPTGGTRGGSMGRTAGGTIGHTRGAQIGCTSIELEQTASTSPFMQTHWHVALAEVIPNVAVVTSAAITATRCTVR